MSTATEIPTFSQLSTAGKLLFNPSQLPEPQQQALIVVSMAMELGGYPQYLGAKMLEVLIHEPRKAAPRLQPDTVQLDDWVVPITTHQYAQPENQRFTLKLLLRATGDILMWRAPRYELSNGTIRTAGPHELSREFSHQSPLFYRGTIEGLQTIFENAARQANFVAANEHDPWISIQAAQAAKHLNRCADWARKLIPRFAIPASQQ
jgi:hypothetical protein